MWDLCEKHAEAIRPPVGWELLKYEDLGFDYEEDDDLTALAEAVREAGRNSTGLVPGGGGKHRRTDAGGGNPPDEMGDVPAYSRFMVHPSRQNLETPAGEGEQRKTNNRSRRGHLRIVPDITD